MPKQQYIVNRKGERNHYYPYQPKQLQQEQQPTGVVKTQNQHCKSLITQQQQQQQKYIKRNSKAAATAAKTVTLTAKLKQSERICGAARRGINLNKFTLKMANTLSVMTNVLRNVVSKQRIRYKENGYNLDLAYICDNIIAMGYPADNIESIFRNRLEDVYKFLQEIHQNHYKIYNLCLERSYDSNKFHGRVAVYPFEDHNPPTIELIQRFCMDVDAWLKADSQNVAAVHCKAGKGRTGTMICCYLLYSGQQKTAEDALECYAEKRTKDRKGVTIPSQRRYVQYFGKLIRSGIPYEKRILQFCEIRFAEANLLHSHGIVHCSISVLEDHGCTVKVMTLLGLPMDFRKSYTLDLKNHSLCVAGDIKVELTHKKKLFHFWFNTYFVRDDAVVEDVGDEAKLVYTLNKCEIDDAHKDKEHKCFSEDFKVQLVFYAENSMRPGLQANVSSVVSQISNNHHHRKSQNARLSHQGSSSGGGDSSSSSNCQLPQNSSSGSDLNYICDQKSSSSVSASVSSFCGPLGGGGVGCGGVAGGGRGSGGGGGGSGESIGGASMSEAINADFLCIDRNHDGTPQFMQHQQQKQQNNKWIAVTNVQQQQQQSAAAAKNSNFGCDGSDYDGGNTPYRRINNATGNSAYASNTQQLQQEQQQQQQQQQQQFYQYQQQPPHTYVNLKDIVAETADQRQHLQHLIQKQQQQQQLNKSIANVTPTTIAPNSHMLKAAAMQQQQQNNVMKFIQTFESTGFNNSSSGGSSSGNNNNKNIQTALQRLSNNYNNCNIHSNQNVELGITTTAKQQLGDIACGGGGSDIGGGINGSAACDMNKEATANGVCKYANSSKSSISSQQSSSTATTTSSSSASSASSSASASAAAHSTTPAVGDAQQHDDRRRSGGGGGGGGVAGGCDCDEEEEWESATNQMKQHNSSRNGSKLYGCCKGTDEECSSSSREPTVVTAVTYKKINKSDEIKSKTKNKNKNKNQQHTKHCAKGIANGAVNKCGSANVETGDSKKNSNSSSSNRSSKAGSSSTNSSSARSSNNSSNNSSSSTNSSSSSNVADNQTLDNTNIHTINKAYSTPAYQLVEEDEDDDEHESLEKEKYTTDKSGNNALLCDGILNGAAAVSDASKLFARCQTTTCAAANGVNRQPTPSTKGAAPANAVNINKSRARR